jgi:simple sugar transport system permease protein
VSGPESTPRRRSWRFPIELRLEPRGAPPRWLGAAVTLGAVILGLLLGAIVLSAAGGDPWRSYAYMVKAAFGEVGVLSDTLVKATPLILLASGLCLAFTMKLWNIGGEGQFFLGAFGASAVVLTPMLPPETSPWLMIPAMVIMGMLAGAVWGFVPGYLKSKFNVNEIITTLMLNYVAVNWNNFFIFAVWTEGGFQMSRKFPQSAWLPRLTDYAAQYPQLRGLTLHLGLAFAIVAAIVMWWVIYRSRWGYEVRLTGDNPRAARYAGINIARNTVLVLMISGALAGLAGVSEIAGVVHRLQGSISPGYGFSAIIVAWLAKLNPLLVIPVSVLFGGLIQAGREIQPSGVPKMLQGIILVCLIASDLLMRYRVRFMRRLREE